MRLRRFVNFLTTVIALTLSQVDWATAALEFAIDEEVPIGTAVGDAKAKYFDMYGIKTEGKPFRLLQTSQQNRGLFEVDQTGMIRVKQRIDRDKMCGSNLICRVEFSVYLDNPTDNKAAVSVFINDINDCAPHWVIRSAVTPSAASPTGGDAILQVNFRDGDSALKYKSVQAAEDGDLGRNGTIRYILENFGAPFHLRHSREDGKLYLEALRLIDREERESYSLTLLAIDDGLPPLSGSVSLLVRVTDVNDNAPQFARQLFSPSRPIFEDEPVNSLVLTLNATDLDSGAFGTVVFDFASVGGQGQETARRLFSVTPDGRVLVKRRLDYDTMKEKSVTFEVIARDDARDVEGRLTATATVSVAVLDRVDEAPNLEVCYLPAGCGVEGSGSLASASVQENLAIGTRVAMVIVHDQDTGDRVECATGPAGDQARDPPAFELVRAGSGAAGDGMEAGSPWTFDLVVKRPLDRESTPRVCYRIVCTDSARHRVERSLCADVADVNDNPPALVRPEEALIILHALEEDKQKRPIGRLGDFVRDADAGQNAALTFSLDLADDEASSFHLDSATGVLTPRVVLDRELRAEYRFRVVVADKGVTPLTATVSVQVLVDDVNDNRPVCLRADFRMQVAENLPPGAVVGRVEATDADLLAGGNGRVAFRAATSPGGVSSRSVALNDQQRAGAGRGALTDWAAFVIEPATGEIRTALPLDRETKSHYSLTVLAEDQPKAGIPRLTGTCHVTVTIDDVNDNRPEFRILPPDLPDSFQVTLREPGQNVGRVQAEDKDEGANGQVEYELLNSADIGDRFAVDRQSGLVLISRSLNSPASHSASRQQRPEAAAVNRQPVEYLLRVKACDRGRPSQLCSQPAEFKAVLAASDAPSNYRGRGGSGGAKGPSGTGNSGVHSNNSGVVNSSLSNEVAIACLIVTFFVLVIACGAVVCLIVRRRSGASARSAMCPTIVTGSAATTVADATGGAVAAASAAGAPSLLVASRETDEAALPESELDNPHAKMMPPYSSYYKDYREDDYGTYNSTLQLKQQPPPHHHLSKLHPAATVATRNCRYYSASPAIGRLLLTNANANHPASQSHYQTLEQQQQPQPHHHPASNSANHQSYYEINPQHGTQQRSRSLPRGVANSAVESAGFCVDGKQLQHQQQQNQQLQQLSRSMQQQQRGPFSPYTEASFV